MVALVNIDLDNYVQRNRSPICQARSRIVNYLIVRSNKP